MTYFKLKAANDPIFSKLDVRKLSVKLKSGASFKLYGWGVFLLLVNQWAECK